MRLLFNYLLDSGNAASAVLLLGAVEVLLRLGSSTRIKLMVKYREKRLKDVRKDSLAVKEFLEWKNRRFCILETENYAEMLSEYLTIFFSTLIHAATIRQLTRGMIHLALIQIGSELVVDWICLFMEQKIGIPIATVVQSKKGLRMTLSMNALLAATIAIIPIYLSTKDIFLSLRD